MNKKIYLDYAGATPIDPRVERMVLRYSRESWGNASSVHEVGRQARKVIENSRKKVAVILGAKIEEIIFTGSGTESDNLAILGVVRAYKKTGKHIITSKIEHPAVLRACEYLQKNEGFKVTYIDVDKNGIVDPVAIGRAIKGDTILVSIMYANNEIGTIQPIVEIAKVLKSFHQKPFFHIDACQAAGTLNLNVNQLGVDLMTLNGSKIYGPKAMGCLYLRRGINLVPMIFGGSQERGLRAGTESPELIAGFAEALSIVDSERIKESVRATKLREYLIDEILKTIPGSHLNGDPIRRLPNNVNMSFEGIDGEMLMLMLDQEGIQVSTGSACTVTSTEPSHVLAALALPGDLTKRNIRITIGRQTKKDDLDYLLAILPKLIKKMKKINPLNSGLTKNRKRNLTW